MKIEKGIPVPSNTKYQNGKNNYKWKCVDIMLKMDIGDSMAIKDRTRDTVATTWLWRAERKTGFKFIVKSIDKNTQRVWRIK